MFDRASFGNMISFPIVDDLQSLLWLINLGCIDLDPWYSRCDDFDRPDYQLWTSIRSKRHLPPSPRQR